MLLAALARDGVAVAVLPVPTECGFVVEPDFLAAALREEGRKYG